MKIDVIAVGRLKEKYLRDACTEYEKRLSRYCRLTVTEVADEKTPEQAGDAVNEKIKELEAQRVLKHLKEDAFIITLEIKGEEMDSEELAERMDRLTVSGVSHFQFVIGVVLLVVAELLLIGRLNAPNRAAQGALVDFLRV